MTERIGWMVLLLLVASSASSAELARRGWLGAQLAPSSDGGVAVLDVLSGSTAERAGLESGDRLTHINNKPLSTVNEAVAVLREIRADAPVKLRVYRADEKLLLAAPMQERPRMAFDGVELRYGAVAFADGHLRTITYLPPKASGPLPVLYVIQGYPCQSVDDLPEHQVYARIGRHFASLGTAVHMVEKPGLGDSTDGHDCGQIDFDTELAAFVAAFEQIAELPFADPGRIGIFGISLGGWQAPLVAAGRDVAGVVVWGTGVVPWHDYLLDLFRIQNPITGADYADNEDLIERQYRPFLHRYFYQQASPAELGDYPQALAAMQWDGNSQILSRHWTFWPTLNTHNVTRAWRETDAPVLSIMGAADLQALNDQGQRRIVEIVNHYRPGTAQFVEIPATDHLMVRTASREEYARSYASPAYAQRMAADFNDEVLHTIARWLGRHGLTGSTR